MFRLLPAVALILAAAPLAAETAQERKERCEIQSGIVGQAVELRGKNKREKRASKIIRKSDLIKGSKYETNVDVLVNWVYGLPKDQLTEATTTAFAEACNAYTQ